ncbi:3'-5' exonuclease, partial [Nocardia cyriacigeorgica]|uniref:3'-5' exonuclease n=1 Tax=Nocardia cyriacigeorgica TaxID=135487 RepID=UPI003CC80A06
LSWGVASCEWPGGGGGGGGRPSSFRLFGGAAPGGWARLSGPGRDPTPFRLRVLPRTGAGPLNKAGFPTVGRMRAKVAADLAADIVRLLESGTTIDAGEHADPRSIDPGDIAVLVRTRSQIDVVREALDRVGVASVLAGGTSVFATESATDWLWVMRALEQPHRSDRVRLAACTPLLGITAAEIDSGGADLVGRVSAQLREAARLFTRAGFAAVFEKLSAESELAPRLLGIENGERRLTDLRHIAQLLDQLAVSEGYGLTALTRWLADRVRDPASGAVTDRSRRLDRDAAAVQIATVHASKGLEFPVVYLPFAWDSARNPKAATLLFHDDDVRVLDVGGPDAAGYTERKRRAEAEESGEELRLLYVALTRAMCQVVAWWAPAFTTDNAPLHRMLLGRSGGAEQVAPRVPVPPDSVVAERLIAWAAAGGPAVAVEVVDGEQQVRPRRVRVETMTGELAAAVFDRTLDQQWRRTSYSALTAAAHALAPDSEPEDGRGPDDEPTGVPVLAAEPETGAPSLMNELPYGAEFGTLVHAALERVDTDAADLAAEVDARCRETVEEMMAAADPALLATALLAVLRTPTPFGALAGIATRDRLCELEFELPLAGGDNANEDAATLRAIAGLLRAHLPATDDFASYADRLDTLDDNPLRGYLTGSIDAVLRIADGRFVIVDYKTNRLGTGDLTVEHYTRDRMAAEMMRSHYPLQALLYSVALHRYLRWRLPGYAPERHLGGAAYLFVRGMIGPDTPPGRGVFDWTPPAGLITDLSDLLAGGAA